MITDTVEKSAEILKDFLVENTIPVLPIKEYSGCLKPIINFILKQVIWEICNKYGWPLLAYLPVDYGWHPYKDGKCRSIKHIDDFSPYC